MKPLKNHTLLYDADCPLCAGYTQVFMKSGLLDEQGRIVYEQGIERYSGQIHTTKARNEIALINTSTGEVKYGIESLLFILSSGYSFFKPVAACRPVLFVLKKIYAFISFNRKVIATSANYTRQTCVPDFNLGYRLLYLLLSAVFTSTILLYYSHLLTGFVPPSNMIREYLICFGQLVFQSLILCAIKSKATLVFDYLGNMMTVSLMGALLLLPVIVLNQYMEISAIINLGYFLLVVLFMFLHHKRRVRNLAAPFWLSYTWLAYRGLVLLFIL